MNFRRHALTTLAPLVLGLTTLFYEGPGHVWTRTHAGDTLLVLFLVGLLGIVSSWRIGLRIFVVAAFTFSLEFAQLLTIDRSGFVQFFIGSHFDVLDFVYYSAGFAIAAILQRVAWSSTD